MLMNSSTYPSAQPHAGKRQTLDSQHSQPRESRAGRCAAGGAQGREAAASRHWPVLLLKRKKQIGPDVMAE